MVCLSTLHCNASCKGLVEADEGRAWNLTTPAESAYKVRLPDTLLALLVCTVHAASGKVLISTGDSAPASTATDVGAAVVMMSTGALALCALALPTSPK